MLSGKMSIGNTLRYGTEGTVSALNPTTGERLEPAFGYASLDDVNEAAELAWQAFEVYRQTTPEERAVFLETIADNMDGAGDDIIARGTAETGLSTVRLTGELARTTNQLRLFATTLREGSALGIRIDPAQPDRTPAPRQDIRQQKIPLGPVAVFGASNFPLAFSSAGGDTASALAAGCPVIVKVHNAHPGTSELVTRAVIAAAESTGMPNGVYSSLIGAGSKIGAALVAHPRVRAVGFTGSRSGGLALVDIAARREVPIPVYAEMSSVNPVFIFGSAVSPELAQGFIDSMSLGSGQFCTSPGSVFVPQGAEGDRFVEEVKKKVEATIGQSMLTPGIFSAYMEGTETMSQQPNVTVIGQGQVGEQEYAPAATVLQTELRNFVANPALSAEVFGATSLIVRYQNTEELIGVIARLEGQLTASIHVAESELAEAKKLIPALEERVGRILVNGWPTGVEVNHAIVHGGPFPATSDGKSTSVGTLAIERFQRAIAYQNFPAELLPEGLQDSNPWGVTRRIDGIVEPN